MEKKERKPKSLLLELSMMVIFTCTLVLGGFGVYQYLAEEKELEGELEELIVMAADRLAISLRTPLYSFYEDGIKDVILAEMSNPIVMNVIVKEPWGSKLEYIYNRSEVGGEVAVVEKFEVKLDYLKASQKIVQDGEDLGEVEILMSKEQIKTHLKKLILVIFIQILVVDGILVTLFLLLLFSRVIKPITDFKKTAKEVTKGDLRQVVKIKSRDEIGELAQVFNEMVAKLKNSYGQLEIQVKEKTSELQQRLGQLSNTKIAMMNLLDDAKELEGDLKKEKEGVEIKVKERTIELQSEKNKLITSINSLSLGFVLTNDKDEILLSNQSLLKMFGYKDDKVLGMNLEKMFGLKELCLKCRQLKKPIEKKGVEISGRVFRLFINPVKGDRGIIIGTVVLIEDVTEIKVLERSRDEFFSIASHELRTPLTAIRGNADMIIDYYGDQMTSPEFKEMVDDIYESSVRLIDIVNDFLNVGRLEQGKLEFNLESFNIMELADQAIRQYQVTGSRRKLGLNLEKSKVKLPLVYADKDKVRQVLINLISNSIKFTEKGGVSVSFAMEGNLVKVLVSDTGRGIPIENQRLLFHKFQQAGSSLHTRDATTGTGLGLYISKLLLKGMGGKIGLVKSEIGKGSIFAFTLPTVH